MEKYSIKVNILNRTYSLLVNQEEEESVRSAAKLISERIKAFRGRFGVKDDLDLVIMCCLELATDNLNQAAQSKKANLHYVEQVDQINTLLNSAILNLEESGAS